MARLGSKVDDIVPITANGPSPTLGRSHDRATASVQGPTGLANLTSSLPSLHGGTNA